MSSRDANPPAAVIFGCAGPSLSDDERRFFAEARPLGFILFARNCETPDQVRALVTGLRAAVGRADAPVLIDQEGGRVQRLKPPHWRAAPAARRFGELAGRDLDAARAATRLNFHLIAAELAELGIDVDCVPVLDVLQRGADDVIGARAFDATPEIVAALGQAACAGLRDGGVQPVIKHIPGYGRTDTDPHFALPVVTASLEVLRAVDFAPFMACVDAPWAMTAHVVYQAIDARPATFSPRVIDDIIRGEIGFEGLLLCDDLSMAALDGEIDARAAAVLAAGCDIVLHCNGDLGEMRRVAGVTPPLSVAAQARVAALPPRVDVAPVDRAALAARLDAMLSDA